MLEHLPFPKLPEKLPIVLSREEVSRLLAASANRMHRTMLMTLYATGVRRAELCQLKTSDVDSQRMVVHVRQGKGRRDRDVPLSPALLEALRAYWRWMKPKTYLFPGLVDGWRADVPITDKMVWFACQRAARAAGLEKHITPHTLRQASAYCTTFQSSFILKTIGLGRAVSAAVYGRRVVPLLPVPVPQLTTDPFSR
jgi:integrase/recombinase XerD